MFGFDEKKKKIFTICSIVYALAILLVVIMTNFDRFSAFYSWINAKFAVLTPVIAGAVIAYICNSLVRFFQNRVFKNVSQNRTRRTLSILSAYGAIILILMLFLILIVPQLLSSVEELVRKISDGTYLNSAIEITNDLLDKILSFRGEEGLEYINAEKIFAAIDDLFMGTENILNQIIEWITTYGGKILTGIKNGVIGFLLSIYFVIFKERLYAQSNRVLSAVCSKKNSEAVKSWIGFADKTLGGFMVGKLIDATLIIFVCSIVFGIAGIPYAILVSVFIGVCNIIPFFGPFIGAIPSGFIIFIAEPDKLIPFIILIIIIQQIDGNIIEPKIVGDRTGLSSLGVLVAVTIMSGYFGLLGMFLGVPIFAIICAIFKKNIKQRLMAKELPTSLKEYYSENSLLDPREEEPEGFFHYLFHVSANWLKKKSAQASDKWNSSRQKKKQRTGEAPPKQSETVAETSAPTEEATTENGTQPSEVSEDESSIAEQ